MSDLISGFDMVNEEDTTPALKEFIKDLHSAKNDLNGNFPVFFHAGESCHR